MLGKKRLKRVVFTAQMEEEENCFCCVFSSGFTLSRPSAGPLTHGAWTQTGHPGITNSPRWFVSAISLMSHLDGLSSSQIYRPKEKWLKGNMLEHFFHGKKKRKEKWFILGGKPGRTPLSFCSCTSKDLTERWCWLRHCGISSSTTKIVLPLNLFLAGKK